METNLNNRVAGKQGRLPGVEKQPERQAMPAMEQRYVPPLTCPKCGRGMVPRVERWRPDGTADCICALGACRFLYTPAVVRIKG